MTALLVTRVARNVGRIVNASITGTRASLLRLASVRDTDKLLANDVDAANSGAVDSSSVSHVGVDTCVSRKVSGLIDGIDIV